MIYTDLRDTISSNDFECWPCHRTSPNHCAGEKGRVRRGGAAADNTEGWLGWSPRSKRACWFGNVVQLSAQAATSQTERDQFELSATSSDRRAPPRRADSGAQAARLPDAGGNTPRLPPLPPPPSRQAAAAPPAEARHTPHQARLMRTLTHRSVPAGPCEDSSSQ
jgi:hypothetical protein